MDEYDNEPWIPSPSWRTTCTGQALEERILALDKFSDFLLDQRTILIEQLKRTSDEDNRNDIKQEIEDIKIKLGDYLTHVQILKSLRRKK